MVSILEKNKWIPWTFTIIIMIFIFYISSLTFSSSPGTGGKIDLKPFIYHMSIFFLLAIFLLISVLNRKWDSKKIILVISLAGIYAILDELHQFFVPGRTASVEDFLLDFTGIVFASLLYFVMIAMNQYKKN